MLCKPGKKDQQQKITANNKIKIKYIFGHCCFLLPHYAREMGLVP